MNDLSSYMAVRDKIQTGDLIQWHSNDMVGSAIMFITEKYRRKYEIDHDVNVSHTASVIRLPSFERDRRYTLESLESGPSLHILSKRLEAYNGKVYWYPVNATEEERNVWGGNALDCIGDGISYGYTDILKFIVERPKIDIKNGLICSEYWMYCWGYAGTSLSPNELPTLDRLKDSIPVRIL
jgi:hypothetical protein